MERLGQLLLYVEPVVFRASPMMLEPWVRWLADLAAAQSEISGLQIAFCSSPWLCAYFSELVPTAALYPIDPADILAPFGMDRIAYARDLAAATEAAPVNLALDACIEAVFSDFAPRAVFSFSVNRYLSARSDRACVLFAELQPLPRTMPDGFFVDCSGHQAESTLVTARDRIATIALSDDEVAGQMAWWDENFTRKQPETAALAELQTWLRAQAQGAPILLLAMQPADWLTFEGLSLFSSMEDVLLDCLAQLPGHWKAVACYHPAAELSPQAEAAIARQTQNLIMLPADWRRGRSEQLLQCIDAVATISSAVGWTALLDGKPVVALGRSNLIGFAETSLGQLEDQKPLSAIDRARIMRFMRHRYCVPYAQFLHGKGEAIRIFEQMMAHGNAYYFDML